MKDLSLGRRVVDGLAKKTKAEINRGLPGREALAYLESMRLGEYERLVRQGAAHVRIFRDD